jgi:dihydrofolate reductase
LVSYLDFEVVLRKVTYSMLVSLDGFIEGPDHNLDWHVIDEEFHQFVNDQQAEVGAWLYGRGMYEAMAAYWPTADADPSQPGFVLEFARIWRDMPKIVFSKTLDKVAWNSRLVRENLIGEVTKLKAQPGKDLSVGGANLAAALIRLDMIDEYQLFVQPMILGSGAPFFPLLDKKIDLKLIETRRFGSGVVFLRYQRAA